MFERKIESIPPRLIEGEVSCFQNRWKTQRLHTRCCTQVKPCRNLQKNKRPWKSRKISYWSNQAIKNNKQQILGSNGIFVSRLAL
jgi:hypothetical protein